MTAPVVVDTDVLVVGFGAAGAAAAIEAARAGARVTVIERLSGAGGSSAQSGGELYLGGGTRLQRACGFEDTAEAMFDFLSAALGPHTDVEKLRLYCDGSVEHFDWFERLGVPFQASLYDAPGWMPPTTDGLMWLGEAAWPYADLARPAPRGHRPAAPYFAGGVLMKHLQAAVETAGARVLLDTRALALVADDDGAVIGLRARRFDEVLEFRVARGVVLTTGGFVDNEAMLADHAPSLLGHGKVSDGNDDGSGITMAGAIGAATRRMSVVEAALTAVPEMVSAGLLVNGLGERFINEDVYPGLWSHAALTQPGPCWVILDEAGFESLDPQSARGQRPSFAAETIDELESELLMPPGSLAGTVAAYNRDAAVGTDTRHHKHPRWLRVLEPPYAAFDPRATAAATGSATGFSGFTLGGLSTTVDSEVRHIAGGTIRGLYAAGRAASGIHGEGYISGTSLGDGTFFGRRAGVAAANGHPPT